MKALDHMIVSESDLLDAVDELLRIEDESGLWDKPGEYRDEGDGHVEVSDAYVSTELKEVIARLRAQYGYGNVMAWLATKWAVLRDQRNLPEAVAIEVPSERSVDRVKGAKSWR